MNSDVQLIESTPQVVVLDNDEAAALRELGQQLASSRKWWGSEKELEVRSVIELVGAGGSAYRIAFRDVIGVVRIGMRQFHVMPKIPAAHFFYLASRSALAPRRTTSQVLLDRGMDFIELLCDWCVCASEELLQLGIRKDYSETSDVLDHVKGRIDVLATSAEVLMGRPKAVCHFEVLSEDSPLNRVVRAACERISRTASIGPALRRRAREVAYRLDDVGPLQHVDLRARIDRLTAKYSRVVPLAHLVLAGCGLSQTSGPHLCTAFLLRTPEIVEDALRSILRDALPEITVAKRRLALGETGLSMNPDLVFGDGAAVGDVKYRLLAADWSRSDLNQVVAFATAFGAPKCGVFAFRRQEAAQMPRAVPVGSVHASSFGWIASASIEPAESAARLIRETRSWLGTAS